MDHADPLDFDDATMEVLTPHEHAAREEVLEWRGEEAGPLQSALSAAEEKAGAAMKWATPPVAQKTVQSAIEGGLEMVQDASRQTFRASKVLEKARAKGIKAEGTEAEAAEAKGEEEISEVGDLAHAPLSALDQLSGTYHMPNKLLAAGEGGICGAGGIEGAAADLPLLFGIAFRGVQQVGTCYGFDMDDPDVKPAVLGLFSLGAGASSAAKARMLGDLHVAAEAFARGWTYKKAAERTMSGTAARVLKKMTRRLPRRIARKVTKQKLAQSLPAIGAAIGAGFNYRFVGNTLRAARMAFRSLYLSRKYRGGLRPPPASA
ncbi:EcsC family protein [Salinibacter sp.]|uniref:EcsC family protein n=1 Tax=Salinibacter sp. TaxID=2065818 RepID=UPI0021E80716|nr:EcsC family protein [Salinibacter sp.]